MIDIPASTGFGEPIQKLFKLKDGEKIVAVHSFDPRVVGNVFPDPKSPSTARMCMVLRRRPMAMR